MSESENQEPVCSSDSSDGRVGKGEDNSSADSGNCNEAEAKSLNSPESEQQSERLGGEPDVVSSSKEVSPVIRNNQEIRVRDRVEDEDEDEDSNDGGVGSNGDREFSAQVCSPFNPYPTSNSKSNPFGSATSQNILRGPILRPSAFKFSCPVPSGQAASSSSSGFVLRPPKLIPNSGSVAGCKVSAQVASSNAVVQFVPLEKGDKEGEGGDGGSGVKEGVSSPPPAFVFGRNLEERADKGVGEGGSVAKKRKIEEEGGERKRGAGEDGDVVREVITGEEGEVNVLQVHCRLFIFDSSQATWIERGRGTLRLNDSKTADEENRVSSRLIVRSKGSLRVMLNTKVWDNMKVEKVSDKNVRLMAVDLEAVEKEEEEGKESSGSAVRIFLVMTNSVNDATLLFNALESRVKLL